MSSAKNWTSLAPWNSSLEEVFLPYYKDGLVPGRVVLEERGVLDVATESGTRSAALSGRLRHRAAGSGELPAIGDWVALELSDVDSVARVQAVLPRRSKISRKVAGAVAVEQLLAANVDVVLLVMGLDGDFNVRRLERLLVMAWESGARPVVVLNKLDLCRDPGDSVLRVEEIAPGVPVVTTTALGGEVEELSLKLAVPLETGERCGLVGRDRPIPRIEPLRRPLHFFQSSRLTKPHRKRRRRLLLAIVRDGHPADGHLRARSAELREQVALLVVASALDGDVRQHAPLETAPQGVGQQGIIGHRAREAIAIHTHDEDVFEGPSARFRHREDRRSAARPSP